MKDSTEIKLQKDEISLKDLINMIQSWFDLLRKNIIPIAVFGLLGGAIGYFFAYKKKVNYKAELRFVVKSEGSSSGLSGMLGGLGSILGGSTMGSPLERTKIEILSNSLIRISELHKVWQKDNLLKGLVFNNQDTSIEYLNFPKRKAIKHLEALLIPKYGDDAITKSGIITKSFDKKSGVVTLVATYENEDFAIMLVKEVFNKLRDFYVEQMITSAANNVQILQKKVDSIKFELSKVQSTYARNTDQSFGLLFQEDKVDLKKLAVREQMLMVMYGEAQKNLETFKFMNDSAIPTLTVIDMPYSPLKKIQPSKILFTVGGAFLGAFLTFLFIAIRLWYKNLMAS